MAKVKASMADVSTEFTQVGPGVYIFEVQEVKEVEADKKLGRLRYDVKSEVIEVEDGEPENLGRTFQDRIHFHKKDGEPNEFGIAQLKRYFEVTVGEERANADDADTDELIGHQFRAQITHRGYEQEDKLTGNVEQRTSAEIARMVEA